MTPVFFASTSISCTKLDSPRKWAAADLFPSGTHLRIKAHAPPENLLRAIHSPAPCPRRVSRFFSFMGKGLPCFSASECARPPFPHVPTCPFLPSPPQAYACSSGCGHESPTTYQVVCSHQTRRTSALPRLLLYQVRAFGTTSAVTAACNDVARNIPDANPLHVCSVTGNA